jgi:cysteine protease ATG4
LQDEQYISKHWTNGVLVIIPSRLGLNKVNAEYFGPIKQIFQNPLNVGIIGGKPSQALYFVGVQKNDLILLDPH